MIKIPEYLQRELLMLRNGALASHHEQDCCELVYADFNALDDTTFDKNIDIEDVEIEQVDNGFRINGYFVPCYNIQNGWYSSYLELRLYNENGEVVKTWDNIDTIDDYV